MTRGTGAFHIVAVAPGGEAHRELETESEAAGLALPLTSRHAWAALFPVRVAQVLALRDARGAPAGVSAIELTPTRALPGHRIARVLRLGANVRSDAASAFAQALAGWARTHGRVLRLHAEVLALDAVHRVRLEAALGEAGLAPATQPRRYARTVLLDLVPDPPAILAGIHKTARQNVRALDKRPLRLAPVVELRLASRLAALEAETMERTGGGYAAADWKSLLRLSREHPRLSRVAGLWRTDREGDDALVGAAWGCLHGDHAEYNAAVSTRVRDLNVSIAYPIVWDLALWAREVGAQVLDLGGITSGGADDTLAGIAEFKRRFAPADAEVGGEWVLEPRRVRALAARLIAGVHARLRGATSRPSGTT